MPDSPTIAGAVIPHAGRVLLIRRVSPADSLLWTFPSGKVDPAEPSELGGGRAVEGEAEVFLGGGEIAK
uniref:NUDIX hydrolase n=1 Tax=Streptomyces sp. bgisy034 TaxID=3413774 RepID=UPI003EBC6CF1